MFLMQTMNFLQIRTEIHGEIRRNTSSETGMSVNILYMNSTKYSGKTFYDENDISDKTNRHNSIIYKKNAFSLIKFCFQLLEQVNYSLNGRLVMVR